MFSRDADRLIHFASFFGFPQISLEPIRNRQDKELVDEVINESKLILQQTRGNVTQKPAFFVGSVDFMVKNIDGQKTYYVLEANGGSSRGFSTLPYKYWRQAYDGYTESLNFIKKENPLIVLGSPASDLLLYEKLLLAEHFLADLMVKNEKASIISIKNLRPHDLIGRPAIVIGDYNSILPRLKIRSSRIYLEGKQVDVLVGDGAARRKKEIVKHLIDNNLKTLVINDVFFITDDKSLTYLSVDMAKDLLTPLGIEPIGFRRAFDYNDLYFKTRQTLDELPEVLVKPHGGSGGSGIDIIADKRQVKRKIETSISHYQSKFGKHRNPYPYTICQRVSATPITWKDTLRHYDIRVYVTRKNNKILPVGALMRIALEPFSGYFTKKSFVVNLSGYEGVDTDRGFGISPESLTLFGLNKKDYARMFAAACTLSAFISNNYKKILKASKAK